MDENHLDMQSKGPALGCGLLLVQRWGRVTCASQQIFSGPGVIYFSGSVTLSPKSIPFQSLWAPFKILFALFRQETAGGKYKVTSRSKVTPVMSHPGPIVIRGLRTLPHKGKAFLPQKGSRREMSKQAFTEVLNIYSPADHAWDACADCRKAQRKSQVVFEG